MSADNYVRSVVGRHSPQSIFVAEQKIQELQPHIHEWANGHRYEIKVAGSLAKGTNISGSSDIDIFISLDPSVKACNTYENVYNTLRNRFRAAGYPVREQNVSVGIDHTGLKVDVVAGVRQTPLTSDHSIWRRKKGTWTQTNIDKHIQIISNSGRVEDIKAVKIWRKLKKLDFPSFYLEMSVVEALKGRSFTSSPSENFVLVMNYLRDDFKTKTTIDPANTANNISDDLSDDEKDLIVSAAKETLSGDWGHAIW